MASFLEEITPPERFHGFEMERLDRDADEEREVLEKQRRTLENKGASLDRQLANLKKLRIRDLLDDAEFLEERQELTRERIRVYQELEKLNEAADRFEPSLLLVRFNEEAASRFRDGSPAEKRLILNVVGSNLRLQDRELKIDVAKPFRRWSNESTSGDLRASLREVRTFLAEAESKEKIEAIRKILAASPIEPEKEGGA